MGALFLERPREPHPQPNILLCEFLLLLLESTTSVFYRFFYLICEIDILI